MVIRGGAWVGWDKNIIANLNMHGTQYHALGLGMGWGNNVHVNLNALWVLFLNRTLCRSSVALAQTHAHTHTRHATLWGSSGALAHMSCYALGIFSCNCAHLKDHMSYGVLIGPPNLFVFLVNSMTSGSEIPDRPCAAWLSHRLKSQMSYSTNIWMRNTAGE